MIELLTFLMINAVDEHEIYLGADALPSCDLALIQGDYALNPNLIELEEVEEIVIE